MTAKIRDNEKRSSGEPLSISGCHQFNFLTNPVSNQSERLQEGRKKVARRSQEGHKKTKDVMINNNEKARLLLLACPLAFFDSFKEVCWCLVCFMMHDTGGSLSLPPSYLLSYSENSELLQVVEGQ